MKHNISILAKLEQATEDLEKTLIRSRTKKKQPLNPSVKKSATYFGNTSKQLKSSIELDTFGLGKTSLSSNDAGLSYFGFS